MRATIQFCTYNRAALLERVLDACFEQTVAPDAYEIVLVNDGSSDGTHAIIGRAIARHEQAKQAGIAMPGFTVIDQANAGLAKGRNVGISRAQGERIIFIDDDVLPLPNFVEEHLAAQDAYARSHRDTAEVIVRGGAINVESFDDLPLPIWSLKHYSGNFFWTTNVSVPLATIRAIGGFNDSFSEYGWEDIDVGLRLRSRGVKAVFNKQALVYHWKPRPRSTNVEKMIRQAQAQARTAVQLVQKHPNWRTHLATGINPVQRGFHAWLRGIKAARNYQVMLGDLSTDRQLSNRELSTAKKLINEAYFEELEHTLEKASTPSCHPEERP